MVPIGNQYEHHRCRIVGKGIYKNVHIGMSLVTTYVNCWHIVRVDVKDGRARIILTLTEYDKRISGGIIKTQLSVNERTPRITGAHFESQ